MTRLISNLAVPTPVYSREFLEQIMNAIADPIFVKDRQHRWILLNDAFCRFMGRPREEMVGKSDSDFFSQSEADVFREKDERVFFTGKENVNEELLTDSTGVTHTIVTKKMICIDNDQIPYVVGVIRDITEQKKAEEELKKLNATLEARVQERTAAVQQRSEELVRSNADLERFAYVASHDLQEPLRMVSSYVQLLERRYKDKLDADAREFIQFAVDGVARMKTLIRDLLEYSRLGRKGKDFAATDMQSVLRQVLASIRITIEEAHASVTWATLPVVRSDSGQLSQVLQNLIANAVKFRGDTPPRVHISAERKDDMWTVSVADNGIGIDAKHKERVFEIFQRLHSSDQYPGTGIGLAVCKKIVERHGGQMWFTSEPGKGSVFSFTLPAVTEGKS